MVVKCHYKAKVRLIHTDVSKPITRGSPSPMWQEQQKQWYLVFRHDPQQSNREATGTSNLRYLLMAQSQLPSFLRL